MSLFEGSQSPWTGRMLSIYRIVAGLVFMSIGSMKLFNFPNAHIPVFPAPLNTQLGVAGVLEVFGGGLIVLGLLTRPVAFLLAGEMAVAYFQGHFPKSPWPGINMGMPAILYCFFYLYLVFAGAGSWSLDALIASSKRPAKAEAS